VKNCYFFPRQVSEDREPGPEGGGAGEALLIRHTRLQPEERGALLCHLSRSVQSPLVR
jgi:hypothetical protein